LSLTSINITFPYLRGGCLW